jgi:4-hydroxybenzoate polyprenyltransferase
MHTPASGPRPNFYHLHYDHIMSRDKLMKIARPRFWMYTFGPFIVGLVAARMSTYGTINPRPILSSLPWYVWLIIIISIDYRLVGANILIYGVNDLADTDTDALNDKK